MPKAKAKEKKPEYVWVQVSPGRQVRVKVGEGPGEVPAKVVDYGRLESRSGAIHPKQAAEFNEGLKKAGVAGAHYDPKTGRLIATSFQARKRALAIRGMVDFNSFGGRA